MTIQEFLEHSTDTLRHAGITSGRLDSLILLEDALGLGRAQILARPEAEILPKTEVGLNTKITQRVRHVPLAYIRGKVEFYGREFVVSRSVLVPRPETEAIIELFEKQAAHLNLDETTIVDVGTGSGAVAITAKLEFPSANVIATDVDPEALEVARQNARALKANVKFLTGDLLKGRPMSDAAPSTLIILANLPYVPDAYPINQAAEHEPRLALFAGADGLDLYRRFWQQIGMMHNQARYVFTESLVEQHSGLASLAEDAGYHLTATEGLAQAFKQA